MIMMMMMIIIIGHNSSNEARFSATFVNYGGFSNKNQDHIGIILCPTKKPQTGKKWACLLFSDCCVLISILLASRQVLGEN